jgi:hypothetical protein
MPVGHYVAYVATEICAGALAAFVFNVLNPDDK